MPATASTLMMAAAGKRKLAQRCVQGAVGALDTRQTGRQTWSGCSALCVSHGDRPPAGKGAAGGTQLSVRWWHADLSMAAAGLWLDAWEGLNLSKLGLKTG